MTKKKIMIVDDEEEFLALTKQNLESTGKYEVATFLSAKDIVSDVHREKPDLILLDLRIPHVGGMEACEMLNRDPAASSVPIVVISGLSKEADKLKAYKLGIVDYLVKPIVLEHLISTVDRVLGYKEACS